MKKQVTSDGYKDVFTRGKNSVARLLTLSMVLAILVYIFYNIVFA